MDRTREYVTVFPRLRSNQAERLPREPVPGWRTTALVLDLRTDMEESALRGVVAAVERTGLLGAAVRLFRSPPDVLEAPEPLWFRFLPATALLVLAARAGSATRFRRQPVVGTYAMENFDADEALSSARAGVPSPLRPLADMGLRFVARTGMSMFGAAYWCSRGARENYLSGKVRAPRRWRTAGGQELVPACQCASPEGSPKDRVVVFCAELARRKGIDVLRAAWELAASGMPGWTLEVYGYGDDTEVEEMRAWAGSRDDATLFLGASRDDVHDAYRRSGVVVLPSVRDGYWREQVGCSVLEGLQHGCRVVATTETGAADWLLEHGHVVIAPGDAAVLASGLAAGVALAGEARYEGLPGRDSRQECEEFLRGLAL